jgi:predicted DNA-binding transcriptional regulator AlpA
VTKRRTGTTTDGDEKWVTLQELLERVTISRSTVLRWVEAGLLPRPKRSRVRKTGRPLNVWPEGVIAHILEIQQRSTAGVPFDDLPKWRRRRGI